MSIATIFQYDAIGSNEHLLPTDQQAAGYDTGGTLPGGAVIHWTQAQYDRHTKPYPAVHIDQDWKASVFTSDILDVESGAATEAEMVAWLSNSRAAYQAKKRPGQRWPAIYLSESNLASAVATLRNGGITSCPFWIANYNLTSDQAKASVATALGAYPRIGCQYTDKELGGAADGSWMSVPWITTTNESIMTPHPITVLPPGSWNTATLTGVADGKSYTATWDGKEWVRAPGLWPLEQKA